MKSAGLEVKLGDTNIENTTDTLRDGESINSYVVSCSRSSDDDLLECDVKTKPQIIKSLKDEYGLSSSKNELNHTLDIQETNNESRVLEAQAIDVFFSYYKATKDNYVLKGVNISVKKGEIYALLGPSGCGKTTLLKCINNSIKPQFGTMWLSPRVSVDRTGTNFIGFMPQELSLYNELTIDETFSLFGRIYGISYTRLQEQIHHYSNTFELPPRTRRVEQLSGGQKRRISLVAALLRDAPLLVLDEPTVGIDPVLRQTVWNYLKECTTKLNKTVLLTTHYVDEAKDANMIGLMRDGQILAEASPATMMNHFNESSLEQCFFKICAESDSCVAAGTSYHMENSESEFLLEKKTPINNKKKVPTPSTSSQAEEIDEKPSFRMKQLATNSTKTFRNIGCIVDKNIKLLKRTAIAMIMQFILPGVIVVLFGIAIGDNVGGLRAAIVNEEDPPYLSQKILSELDTFSVIQHPYRTLEEGINSVKNGENLVAIHFQPDFSYCLLHRINLGFYVNNATLDCSSMKLYMDTTNQILSINMHRYILKSFFRVQEEVLVKDFQASPLIGGLPVMFAQPVYGSLDVKYRDYVTPTVLLVVIFYLATALTGVSLILEQENGVFQRLQVAGVTKAQIFVAQIFTSCLVVIVQVVIMLVVQFSVFSTDVKGNMFFVVVIVFLQGINGTIFGFFISSVTKRVSVGLMIGMGCMYPNLVLCGFIWPLEGMPLIMRKISNFVPMTLSIQALRSILSRGWGLSYEAVWLGMLSAVGLSAFFLLVGMFFYRLKK